MTEIEKLWGDDEEEKKESKKEISLMLGSLLVEKGDAKAWLPVTLSKDPQCWVLRVGSKVVYPSNLAGVFEHLHHAKMNLNGVKNAAGLLEESKKVAQELKEWCTKVEAEIKRIVGK